MREPGGGCRAISKTGLIFLWSGGKDQAYALAMKQLAWFCAPFVPVLLASQIAYADQVDTLLESQMREHRIPGLTLKIIRDGTTSKTPAYRLANVELNVRPKPQTVFEIGSITKQFTAAGILLLP